ncbi:hypothetical protein OKW42_006336 [Paraburkholderia sp. WC7.3d]
MRIPLWSAEMGRLFSCPPVRTTIHYGSTFSIPKGVLGHKR